MTSLPCTCILENIKYSASSDVRLHAGCSQHQEVNVVKRNKDLASGEFIVFVPLHRKRENVNAESSAETENASQDSKAEEWARSHGSNFVKVKATSEVERGKYLVRLERPTIYTEVLKQTLCDLRSRCERCMHFKSATATINCAMLNDLQKEAEVTGDWRQLSLGQLRQALVAVHVARLLQSNCFLVSNITYPASKIVDNFVNVLFGTDFASTVQASSETDDKPLASQLPASGFDCISLLERYRSSPYTVEIDATIDERVDRPDSLQSKESKDLVEVVLDLKKFVADNSSRFLSQQKSLRKNLHNVCLNRSSSIISQISCLESHRLRIKSEASQSLLEQNSLCVHITSYEREFNQHLVATAWNILEPTVDSIKQVHVVCGPIVSRHGAKPLEYAQDFFDLRYEQMKNAFTMKYGTNIQEDGWKNRVRSLTNAAVIFEMLSTICRQEVKLCLSSDVSSDEHLDYKGGVFVMYNFARLSTLFLHFEEAVAKGTYPALVELDSVDFSLLKQEEEWGLLFNYVLLYPNVLKGTVEDSAESSFQSIHTHKICQFLMSLSSSLSIYYSKTHILCEPRPHLMPLMFARLYLMKGIQKIMLNCFGLLGIEPCPQL